MAAQQRSPQTQVNQQERQKIAANVPPLPKANLMVNPVKETELTHCVVLGYN